MADRDGLPWERHGTREEILRRAVFVAYKSIIKGHPITREQIGHIIDANFDRMKSLKTDLSRDMVAFICVSLSEDGWFEPDSAARRFLDQLPQDLTQSDLRATEQPKNKESSVTHEEISQKIVVIIDDEGRGPSKGKPLNDTNKEVIEISDDDSEDAHAHGSDDSHAQCQSISNTKKTKLPDAIVQQHAKSQPRVNQVLGRIQKPGQGSTATRTRAKARATFRENRNERSGKGGIPRPESRKEGTGIASSQSLNMSFIGRHGAIPIKHSLGGYYIDMKNLPFMPFKLQHTILTSLQNAVEDVCFRFARKWLPMILDRNSWDTPEAIELSLWWICLEDCQVPVEAVRVVDPCLSELFRRLRHVRHCAVHRVAEIPIRCIQSMVADAIALSTSLNDDLYVPVFQLWATKLKSILDLDNDPKRQPQMSEAVQKFESIRHARQEASRKLDETEKKIAALREELDKLGERSRELRREHTALSRQEEESRQIVMRESSDPVKLDAEISRSLEECFGIPNIDKKDRDLQAAGSLSGPLVTLRDVGTRAHVEMPRPAGATTLISKLNKNAQSRVRHSQVDFVDSTGASTLGLVNNASVSFSETSSSLPPPPLLAQPKPVPNVTQIPVFAGKGQSKVDIEQTRAANGCAAINDVKGPQVRVSERNPHTTPERTHMTLHPSNAQWPFGNYDETLHFISEFGRQRANTGIQPVFGTPTPLTSIVPSRYICSMGHSMATGSKEGTGRSTLNQDSSTDLNNSANKTAPTKRDNTKSSEAQISKERGFANGMTDVITVGPVEVRGPKPGAIIDRTQRTGFTESGSGQDDFSAAPKSAFPKDSVIGRAEEEPPSGLFNKEVSSRLSSYTETERITGSDDDEYVENITQMSQKRVRQSSRSLPGSSSLECDLGVKEKKSVVDGVLDETMQSCSAHGKPKKKKRKSDLRSGDLCPIEETIYGGVPEGLENQDFVALD